MLYLSRRVDFSATHVYNVAAWSSEKNESIFGRCNNRNGHGHDYKLEVMVKGRLNWESGIVVNTTDIKNIVNDFIKKELDGKFLNREHPYFMKNVPTSENMVDYIWAFLKNKFEGCELHRIRLFENHYLSAIRESDSLTCLTRKYHFCAAHRLHSDQLSTEENIDLFGKCNNPHGHGHNYYLDVTVKGKPHPETGMIINLTELDTIVERVVLNKFDHKHLNLDTAEFANLNPTAEAVAMVIYNMLAPHLPGLHKIGLWETEKNYFEYCGQDDDE
ncbi:6-carboxytetrahydropterin synthase [Paenibacillus frigoriresistens]|uniref:6-carboxytetrahydropterin synthase n=1 Tax=Paenibacillus alginolyticus TaxID=59839 RepID=UPI00156399EC|nr:6-carboxytetrahydropterin synthase [Paenibacillus frigoriresistens]NRF95586.1 6-carboxytetrahydropterin synthase [Paenibacillus frigoriresistens]